MTTICIRCSHTWEDHDEPGLCPACGTWNQSERFKAELRSAIEGRAGARARVVERASSWAADGED